MTGNDEDESKQMEGECLLETVKLDKKNMSIKLSKNILLRKCRRKSKTKICKKKKSRNSKKERKSSLRRRKKENHFHAE